MLKEPPGRTSFLMEKDEQRIINYFKKNNLEEYADVTTILIDTGLRRGELFDLNYKENIKLDLGIITVKQNKEGDKPKSIPMTNRVKAILAARRREGEEDKPFTKTRNGYSKAWQRMRVKLGYKKEDEITPHILRHTCASRLIQRGADLYTVQKYLGHSTIKVTERYAHLQPDKLREASNLLEKKGETTRRLKLVRKARKNYEKP